MRLMKKRPALGKRAWGKEETWNGVNYLFFFFAFFFAAILYSPLFFERTEPTTATFRGIACRPHNM